ncbi:MAG: hypothetical protein QE279_11105 [Rhodoferax sp.]|nr:hypothetical protein [Rhodoferax sp.]
MISALFDVIKSFVGEIFSAIVGVGVGLSIARINQWKTLHKRRKFAGQFFGCTGAINIVHSAVFDAERGAYDLPACDTTGARYLSAMFERAGLIGDRHYFVNADVDLIRKDGTFPQDILESNLVLLCSPKRNKLTTKILASSNPRYQFCAADPNQPPRIIDMERGRDSLVATRDKLPVDSSIDHTQQGYDFAIVSSFPNPFNHERVVVIIAGIHGTGTLGAARFVSTESSLSQLLARKHQKKIQEVLRVHYSGGYESIADVRLV